MNTPRISRREALRLSALGAGLILSPRLLRSQTAEAPSPTPKPDFEPMRIAFIGCGLQGSSHVKSLTQHRYVAFCDVDEVSAAKSYTLFPDVPRYRDFRVMLDRHAKDIDVVVIATPDHVHVPAALFCIAHGKHVYIEKPLATSIWEAQELQRVAATAGVKTQMGIHGHSMGGLRLLKEWLNGGAVGEIQEVYAYTNRMEPKRYQWATEPAAAEPVPETLSWDLWLAGRPTRPYNHCYTPDGWHNWWEFGTGAIGNIGSHEFDVIEFCLELGYPDSVEAKTPAISTQTIAPWEEVTWRFPANRKRLNPLALHWWDGNKDGAQHKPTAIPNVPPELIAATANATAYVGTKGTLFMADIWASRRPQIFPAAREQEFLTQIPPAGPRPKGKHIDHLFRAIQHGGEAAASLAYSSPLTEVFLLGNVAIRHGSRIEWDHEKRWVKGFAADHPLLRPQIDPAWLPGI